MYRTLQEDVLYRLQCLKDQRESFEEHWRELAEHVVPRSYRYLDEDTSKRGNKASKKIIDPTATIALRAMEAAFSASITPTTRPWKKLRVRGDEGYDVKSYLEQVSETMDAHLLDSNFYREAGKFYSMCGLFGTAAMLIEEDEEDDILCETLPVGSFWLGIDGKRRVNSFAREVEMSITQIVETFGIQNVSESNRSAYENGMGDKTKIKVVHLISPTSSSGGKTRMAFESIYIDPTDNERERPLRVSGYEEFPVIVARWSTLGDDVYGINCPGMIALGHIKELQHAHKQVAKALEKQVNPPTQRPEGTMRKGIDLTPGADNVVANRGASSDGIKPIYQINFDISGTRQHIEDIRDQIREVFFYNLFLMVANERRSGTKAREIDELHEEKMIVLSTVYEQFSHEFLDPVVERVFRILERRGRLPVPPPSMEGRSFDIEYVSIMAQAMKLVGIGNMDRALAILGQTASIDPTTLDVVDMGRFTKAYVERLGIDNRILSSPQEIEDKRKAREDAQQQHQAMQQATVDSEVAKNLASAKTDEDNALTQMMGNTIG